MKRSIYLLIISLLIFNLSKAQDNFYTILDSLYQNDSSLLVPDSLKSGSAKNIDRMKEIWSPRLSPHGDVSIAAQKIVSYSQSFEDQVNNKSGGAISANWTAEGPFGSVNSSSANNIKGNGQVNRLVFDPKYNMMQNGVLNQTIYAGSFYGGLWRTEDGGQNWSVVNTDEQLPQTSVSGIAVSYQNSDHLFISTGRGDGIKFFKDEQLSGEEMPIFTNGVYRSQDYGQTWEPINNGLLSHFSNGGTIRNIIVDSSNANNLYVASTEGVFKSSNALSSTPSWTKLTVSTASGISEDFKGLEQHPTDMSTIYTASNDIFKSSDGGSTWSSMTGFGTGLDLSSLPGNFTVKRINLAVSPAASDRLYAYINGTDTKNSNNQVKSAYIYMYKNGSWQELEYFNYLNDGFNNLSQSWMGLAVSPVDPEMVYFSFTKVFGSHDINNQNFSDKSGYGYGNSGYHADTHVLEFEPNTPTSPKLFAGNHGGVSVKDIQSPGSNGWNYKNNGLNLALIWSFDISKTDQSIKVIGRQDNGAHKYVNGNWTYLGAGDGYGAQIYNDNLGHRFTYHSGVVHNGTNMNLPLNAIRSAVGSTGGPNDEDTYEWVAKQYQIHEHPISGKPVFGFSELYTFPGQDRPTTVSSPSDWTVESDLYRETAYLKSNGYTPIFHWPGSKRIREFAIAQSNPDYTYLATFGYPYPTIETIFFRSTTGLKNGVYDDYRYPSSLPPRTFLNVNEDPLSNFKSFITYNGDSLAPFVTGIAINPTNENEVWISVSGFNPNLRVLKSTNGGITWSNADPNNSLPEMPANNIVYQNGSNNRLYLATDVGVYVKDDSMSDWQKYGDIPNVRVNELYIRYCDNKLYAGTYGRGIWSVDLMDAELNEMSISSNVTWDTDRFIESSILVKDGVTLTVKGNLYMPKDAKIIVETGGALVIDGGHITNSCNSFWQGVELYGNDSLPQYSQVPLQPYVSVTNGGEITNARVAVRSGITDANGNFVSGTSGGLIMGDDATFRNNLTDIVMHPYQNYAAGTNPKLLSKDISRCEDCSFISDAPLPNSLITSEHININGIDGLTLKGCTFKNDLAQTNLSDRGAAIRTHNSSYEVIPDGSTRTLIENFYLGIDNYASNPMYTPTIKKTDFINNVKGMHVAGCDYATIVQNKFEIMDAGAGDEPYGLYLNWCTGYEIEENNFTYIDGGTASNAVGLVVMNSNNNVDEIYRNNFDHLQAATLVHGYNKLSGTSEGLVIKCNDYESDAYHIALESINMAPYGGYLPPEIAQNQGGNANKTDPAGNTFNDLCPGGSETDIFISSIGSAINYFHHLDAITEPLCTTISKVSNVMTAFTYTSRDESCPSNLSGGGGEPPIETGFVSYSGNDFSEALREQLSNKSNNVEALKLNDYVRLKLLKDTIEMDSVILALAASGTSNNQMRMIAAMARKGDTTFNDKSFQNLLSEKALDYIKFSKDLKSRGKFYVEAKNSTENPYFMWAKVHEHSINGEKIPSNYQLPQSRIREINEISQKSNITVYPNPTDEQLTIELEDFDEEDEIQVEILDVKGSLLKSVSLNLINPKQKLSVAELKNGVYLLNIHKNGKLMATERFSVQH